MSTKEKTIIIVSSIFVGGLMLIGLAVAMYSVGANLETTTVKKETPSEVVEPEPVKETPVGDEEVTLKSDKYSDFLAGAEGIFMGSCDDGTNTSYCRCAYNWLDDNLTNDEFYDTTQKALKGDIPSIMYEAARACKNYN